MPKLDEVYAQAREGLASVEAWRVDRPPTLKDFLNAGMPEWMARAAERQCNVGTAGEIMAAGDRATASAAERHFDRRRWWEFVQGYAASGLNAPER